MKKFIALILSIVTVCFATCALASTTTGPSKIVTAATSSKASAKAEPTLDINTLSIGGTGEYIFWVRYNANDKQVSPTYKFSSGGKKTIYYMSESRDAGYVVAKGSYSARFKSNSKVSTTGKGTVTLNSFTA